MPLSPHHHRRPGLPGPARARPSASTEDYLERIGELADPAGQVRMVDVARALGVSRPSVTAMVRRLAEAGYVDYTRYQGLVLTDAGRTLAAQMKARHATLKQFLALLGVDEATQELDVESWEHCLSAPTIARIEILTRLLERRPEILRQLRKPA
jgi:Mn-dependent DtxR family transcriptional regulator